MSNLINKAKELLSSDKNTTSNNPRSDNYGPHSSNVLNSADPRVDSDLDHRNNPHSTVGNTTSGGAYTGSANVAPHNSHLANQVDPRVDSSTYGHQQHTAGGYGSTQPTAAYDTATTGGYGSSTTHGSTNAGPHNSNLLNKLDPRVDSDLDGRNNPNSTYGSTTSGGAYTDSTYSGSTNAGPHSSNYANKLDPRVDSDRDHRNDPTSRVGGYGAQEGYGAAGSNPVSSSGYGSHHTGPVGGSYGGPPAQGGYSTGGAGYGSSVTPGSGNANQTAGPHNSNLLNKLDPRVDSDMDGSKTYGGSRTNY